MPSKNEIVDIIETVCDRLSERTATLFLGAGINAGLKNSRGDEFPLGDGLSKWVCRDLLEADDLDIDLPQAAEIARQKLGSPALNQYLFDKFSEFSPGIAHTAVVQLPWDVIYTTNYDMLVETAASLPAVEAAGKIQAIFSTDRDLTSFTEDDILYYKLHGSVDVANTDRGRLILTKEDYRYYELHRKPLFKRLESDLQRHTFIFVGYSMNDPNFGHVIEDSRNALGALAFPRSIAIRPGFHKVQKSYWLDKYNIELADMDGGEFLTMLRDTWFAQNRQVIPFEERKAKAFVQADQETRFERVADSYYLLRPADCTGASDAKRFFLGGDPSWADIRDHIAPNRDAYDPLLDALFPELADPTQPLGMYLVTGPAGTGKTTLVKQIAYDIAKDFQLKVLVHIPGTPLEGRALASLVNTENPERIVIIIRDAADYIQRIEYYLEELRQKHIPATVIMEERKNQWEVASANMRMRLAPVVEFELGSLSSREINVILDALTEHDALGKLAGTDRDYQERHFTALADKDLLVALRELTTQSRFDQIVKDEYESIPSDVAKEAYLYVAMVGQLDLALRYETLQHLLGIPWSDLRPLVFTPTLRILISGEETGWSRHNAGFRLRTRHSIIASVIYALAAPDDETKFKVLNQLLTQLDPGYSEDRRLLDTVVRRKELVNTFASVEKRRAVYDRLSSILPNSAFVLQHRSIVEREIGDADLAIRYARAAVQLDERNPTLINTLGSALEFGARQAHDPLKRKAMLAEASKLFDEGVKRDPSDPYAYIGKVQVLRSKIEEEADPQVKALMEVHAMSFLEEAFEATNESPMISGELAKQRRRIGDLKNATEVLETALKNDPTASRLRDLQVRFLIEQKQPEKALACAFEGAKHDPISWRLQRHIARLSRVLGKPVDAVRGHYEAALRHQKGSISLMVEFASYLYMQGLRKDAERIFAEAKDLRVSAHERSMVRQVWVDDQGTDRIFEGSVHSIQGAAGWILVVPDNFMVFYWRTNQRLQDLKAGDKVKMKIGFNAYGPILHRLITILDK